MNQQIEIKKSSAPVALHPVREVLQNLVKWDPEIHYFRDSETGEQDDGPYVRADGILALKRQAAELLTLKEGKPNASK